MKVNTVRSNKDLKTGQVRSGFMSSWLYSLKVSNYPGAQMTEGQSLYLLNLVLGFLYKHDVSL